MNGGADNRRAIVSRRRRPARTHAALTASVTAFAILAATFSARPATAQSASRPGRRPNVLILFPDQLRWCSVGCYGDPMIRSPHIDRLAAEGVRFTHAFTNFPVCSPARSILLSGCHARSTGVFNNQDNEASPGRPTNTTKTLAETLRDAGYATALVGKWHLAPTPKELGFDESLRTNMRHRYFKQTFRRNEGPPYVHDGYGPFHETDAAVAYIREKRDRPFFLFVTYGPPHMPVSEMPEKYVKMYDPAKVPLRENVWRDGKLAYSEEWFKIYMWDFQYYQHKDTWTQGLPAGMNLRDLTALYYGQITAMDDCVGRVLDAVREAGLEEDTIVLFASDHGDLLGSHELFNKNRHFDEAIRIPMLVRYPRLLKPRVIDSQVASLVDVMPTLLDLCGVAAPESLQGVSLGPVLAGRTPASGSVGENAAFIETGTADGIRTRQYLYAVTRQKDRQEELYDVDADPCEMKNLVTDPTHADIVQSLRGRLRAWQERTPIAPAAEARLKKAKAGKRQGGRRP